MTKRLEPGDEAPDFTLSDPDGTQISLSSYAGRRVIVYFYPAALTPGCTTQAIDFTAAIGQFHDAGIAVVGISPDASEKLAKFREKSDIGFPLLSDPQRSVLQAYGAFGVKKLYGKEMEGVIRSTFVVDVDDSGTAHVVKALYNVKATGHVERLARDLGVQV